MSAKQKYYVVWEGANPGIYDNWEECQEQVTGFPNAKFKAYNDLETATAAFRGNPSEQMGLFRAMARQAEKPMVNYSAFPEIRLDALAVDAACSRNPGPVEYRCVRVADGLQIFHNGPLPGGTNNIGEYLAIIHAAGLLRQRGDTTTPIYSDSRTAQSWIRRGHSNTKLVPTAENERIRQLLIRADKYLATYGIPNPLLKWDTERWGEIPADFGRK